MRSRGAHHAGDDVASAVGAVIEEFEPTVVVTLDSSDGHRDHAHMRDAVVSAVERRALPDTRLYLHCLPRSLMRRWVEEMRRQQPDSDYLGFADLGTPDEQITTVIDTTEYLGLREQAIAIHRSQTSPFEICPPTSGLTSCQQSDSAASTAPGTVDRSRQRSSPTLRPSERLGFQRAPSGR